MCRVICVKATAMDDENPVARNMVYTCDDTISKKGV